MSPRARWLAVEIALKSGIVVLAIASLGALLVLPKNLIPAATGMVLGIFTWDTLRRLRRMPRRRDDDVLPTYLGYVQVAILGVALWLEIVHGLVASFAIGLAVGAVIRLARSLVVNSTVVRRHEEIRARGFDG